MAQTITIENMFANTKAGHAAKSYFLQNGLPSRKIEDFHYTDISRALNFEISDSIEFIEYPKPIGDIEIRLFENDIEIIGFHKDVIINQFEPETHTDLFANLIYGMAKSGHKITIGENAKLSISIIRFGNSRAIFDIEIGKNADIEIFEIYDACGLNAFSAKLSLAENTNLNLYSFLKGGGTDLSAIGAVQAKNSVFNAYFVTMGGQLMRRNFGSVLSGDNAKANISGVYLLGDTHFDLFTNIIHKVPNCQSNENVRGIVANKAHAVFQGKIFVAKDAQKTIGKMQHRAIMLEEGAKINAKPCLEIYADDVECSHANTIGALDDKALFYMQARGISQKTAKSLLIKAFVYEVFDELNNDYFHAELNKQIEFNLGEIVK